jgi:hypothetical protein
MDNTMQQEHIEAVATSAKIMYGGAGATVLFGLTASEIGAYCALASFVVTLLGFAANFYFKLQENKRKQELHDIKLGTRTLDHLFDDEAL